MESIHSTFAQAGLVRPQEGRVLAGVIAGLGRRVGLDPWPAPGVAAPAAGPPAADTSRVSWPRSPRHRHRSRVPGQLGRIAR